MISIHITFEDGDRFPGVGRTRYTIERWLKKFDIQCPKCEKRNKSSYSFEIKIKDVPRYCGEAIKFEVRTVKCLNRFGSGWWDESFCNNEFLSHQLSKEMEVPSFLPMGCGRNSF